MINFPIRIDNGNVIKNKPIKTNILNSLPKFATKKFSDVAKIIVGIKNGIIRINWINLFLLTCNENKAESIEIKVIVGKEIINRTIISIISRKLTLNKIDDIGIKIIFGITKDMNITRDFDRNITSSEYPKNCSSDKLPSRKSSKTKLSEIKIIEKIVIIHKIGLYMVERIKMSGPIAKTKSKIDVKKKVQYEYKLFVF